MAAKSNMRTAVFIELSAHGQWLDQLSNLQMAHKYVDIMILDALQSRSARP